MKKLLLRYLLVHYYKIYKFIINVYTFFKVGRWGGQFNGAACEMHAIPEKGGGGWEMRGGRMPPCASSPCPPASRPPLVVPTSLGLVFLRPRFPSSLRRLVLASPCPRRCPLWGRVATWRARCGRRGGHGEVDGAWWTWLVEGVLSSWHRRRGVVAVLINAVWPSSTWCGRGPR